MTTPEKRRREGQAQERRGRRTCVVLLSAMGVLLPLSRTHGMQMPTSFTVAGAQFHQRDPEDAGEARICLQNTGGQPLSMSSLKVRIRARNAVASETQATEYKCVYARLSPPILPPGHHGEIVAKLLRRPAEDGPLICDLSVEKEAIAPAVPLAEPPLWISFTGFGEDLRRVFVYVENPGPEPVEAQLLHVGPFGAADGVGTTRSPIPPKDKRCLIGDLPSALTAGEFVHVAVGESTRGRESKVHAVVRVIRTVPVALEFGGGDPGLGLDGQRSFLETMACPAHAHGSPEEAAAQFLQDYAQQFSRSPRTPIQMAICRSGMPGAWFRFGSLPDVAAVNTCLRPPWRYEENPQKWFCPFACVGELAKKATEPGRFLAIMPTGPDVNDESFLLQGLTSQEWRFLVYSALASGAKGISYRGAPADDPLSRDAFRQVNRELRHIRPLLAMAEPVEWTTTEANDYAARSLLCGDQAILIVVFDCRYLSRQRNGKYYTPPLETTGSLVRVNARIPAGVTVKGVATPYAVLSRSSWDYRDNHLGFTAPMTNSAQVYIASLQGQAGPSEEGVPR